MSTGASASFPISLRPWSESHQSEGSIHLDEKLRLIHEQRNGLRNVKEEDLEAEIAQGRNEASEDEASESDEGDEKELEKGSRDAILRKGGDMNIMLKESSISGNRLGDMISLAESSVLEGASASMSQPLKDEQVPKGSLAFAKWHNMREYPARTELHNQVWKSSFMTSLTESADTLLAAATRLESQVKSETEYWGQLLSLTSNGWPVYKRGLSLEVKFGASEAGPQFLARGHAALVPDKAGVINLRQLGSEPKTLRIRLSRGGKVVASNVTSDLMSLVDLGSSVEDKVRRAQSSLFEEELFYEMVMESRMLQPLGVKLRSNVLHLPGCSDRSSEESMEYLIDLLPLDDAANLTKIGSDEDKTLLTGQGVLLRLLLCHVHHLRLQRRSRVPPPLTEAKSADPPAYILRAFLALIQHHGACLPFSQFTSDVYTALKAAGIPAFCNDIHTAGLHELLQDVSSLSTKKDSTSSLHSLLESLGRPRKTTVELKIAKSRSNESQHAIKIHLHTSMSLPLCGSEFAVEIPQGLAVLTYGPDSQDKRVVFPQLPELKSFLCQLLSYHVSHNLLLPKQAAWKAADDAPVVYKAYEHEGKEAHVAVGVKVSGGEVEMRRKWVGEAREQESKRWSTETANDERLFEVFDGWVKEAEAVV